MRKRIFTKENIKGERVVVNHFITTETVETTQSNEELKSFEKGLRNKIKQFKQGKKNENYL
jgi:hypothetical protein|nr:MAG TPA: hypothetical protein [Caudoviricetes sp.]